MDWIRELQEELSNAPSDGISEKQSEPTPQSSMVSERERQNNPTPQTEPTPTPKAVSTDRHEAGRKPDPTNDADKSDADRLLDVWEQKHPYEIRHREQVIDMAIYAGLFGSKSGREAKWKAISPALIRWEDEGKITAWLDARYQINPLKFPNLR